MAFGIMIPGWYSGTLADSLGYEKFFLLSFLASLPGIISIFFLPLAKTPGEEVKSPPMISELDETDRSN
jgi:hypothetical protein